MMEITKGKIRYTIKAVVEFEATEHEDLESILDGIRQYGTAEVEKVEAIEEEG